MFTEMPPNTCLSADLPEWLRLAIADAVVVFGRMEQEAIEISWLLNDAELKQRLKIAQFPATKNFIEIIEAVERAKDSLKLDAVKDAFRSLANERNLMVHGAWAMTDEKPWVVWHKFAEDTESVIGEHFEAWRFERFMVKAEHLLNTLRRYHDQLEAQTGKRTTAMPRD